MPQWQQRTVENGALGERTELMKRKEPGTHKAWRPALKLEPEILKIMKPVFCKGPKRKARPSLKLIRRMQVLETILFLKKYTELFRSKTKN